MDTWTNLEEKVTNDTILIKVDFFMFSINKIYLLISLIEY